MMKHIINNSLIALGLALIAAILTLGIARAFPSGWRVPFYNDGRAMISNGPGEGQHTGVSAQAIDFLAMDTWETTRDVRATHGGTVRVAAFFNCPGNVVAIEQTAGGNASFYYHLNSFNVAVGQFVSRGTIIGDYGGPGHPNCGTLPHPHFEGRSGVNWNIPLTSGTPIVTKDMRGIGFYPWWPHPDRYSGLVVQSTSHTIGVCSANKRISVRWPPASGVFGNNIDGYSWVWTTTSSTVPDTIKEAEEDVSSTLSPTLPNGSTWYFNLRVRDNDGNWSTSGDVARSGNFWVSTNCPISPEP